MTVAFVVLAHSDPKTLRELLKELRPYQTFLHIDRPTMTADYLEEANLQSQEHVVVNEKPRCLHWGGFSIVQAMMETLQLAVEKSRGSTKNFAFLSGQCFPLRPVGDFVDHLEVSSNPVLCRAYGLSAMAGSMGRSRVDRRHWLDGASGHLKKSFPFPGRLFRRLLVLASAPFPVDIPQLEHACGSQWVSVPRELAIELIGHYREGGFDYLRQSFAADEVAIPSYIYNSAWKERTPAGGFENPGEVGLKVASIPNFHWLRSDMDGILNEGDIQKALDSNAYFVRKLSYSVQSDVFDEIRARW